MDKCKCIDCHNVDIVEDNDDASSVASSIALDGEEEEEQVVNTGMVEAANNMYMFPEDAAYVPPTITPASFRAQV